MTGCLWMGNPGDYCQAQGYVLITRAKASVHRGRPGNDVSIISGCCRRPARAAP